MPRTVLIADSDISTLELISAVLTRSGFKVEATNDGGDALSRFLDGDPCLVVCGDDLSGLSGRQLCQQIRAQKRDVRVILLSPPERQLEEVGCDAVVKRPFRFGPVQELLIAWGLLPDTPPARRRDSLTFNIPPPPPLSVDQPATSDSRQGLSDAPIPIPIPGPDSQKTPPAATSRQLSEGTSVLPPSVPRFSDLSTVPLPRLMFELYIGTYSGKVRLSRKRLKRTLYFWAGMPVRVDSEQLAESLGVLLRESKRISEEQYLDAQRLSIDKGMPLGEALIELGILRESQLLTALNEQTEYKVIHSFAWREGTYQIEDDTSFAQGSVLNEVSPLRAIWRGVHAHYELNALMGYFAKLRDRFITVTDLFELQFKTFEEEMGELNIAALLDGKTTFEQALSSDVIHALEIAQALYVFLVTDMIRPSRTTGRPAPPEQRRRRPAARIAPIDYRYLMEVSDRIAREYLRIKGKDYFEVLQVDRTATPEQVEEAFRDASTRMRKDTSLEGLPHDSVKRGREIIETLVTAHRVLTGDAERLSYLESVGLESAGPTDAADHDRRQALFASEKAYKEGLRLLEMLDPRGARQQFEIAIAGNPSEPTYHVAIAQAAIQESKDDPSQAVVIAAGHLTEAIRLDPGNLLANIEAARLFASHGMKSRARVHLERVLQRAPEHAKAKRMLADLDRQGTG